MQATSIRTPSKRRWLIVALTTAIATGAIGAYRMAQPVTSKASTATAPAVTAVTALGRLEPKGEVIQLAAPTQGVRIEQLRVRLGDRVQKGQIIAVLDSRDRLQAALDQAKRRVDVAQTRLAQVEAGAKTGEINAQQATIDRVQVQLRQDVAAKDATVRRLEAEVQNADLEYRRYESLYRDGAVNASQRDGKKLTLDVAMQQLNEARANRTQTAQTLAKQVNEAEATLDRIAEVRPVDVQAARADVNSAIAAVRHAQAEL
ncbi:biotin/lipoyl-binding protein, partial [Leptolyngbya sp. FACHB-36]|uniref:biotin/lipoyl-binding protein n=1 Tax=Leptolyngbya sp. FACHB-36 TaxID=2692808 RepID=UPI0016806ABD